jgi:hypothetical protein
MEPPRQWGWKERLIALLEVESVANAAGFTCGSATWGGTSTAKTYTPPTCTIVFPNGTSATSSWTGQWTFTFSLCGAPAANTGAVNSGCVQNTTVTRTSAAGITRNYSGPFGANYAMTANTSASTAYDGTSKGGGDVITCTDSAGCPATGQPTRTWTLASLGSHITGTIDGATAFDHLVYTTTSIGMTGSGPARVITGGVVVVKHNLANFTSTTTFNGPLNHVAGCPFPVSGSVTTALSRGGSETVSFSSTCGQATLTVTGKSAATLHLHQVF